MRARTLALSVVLVALASGIALAQGTGYIKVKCDDGVEVFLDGVSQGVAEGGKGLTLKKVAVGSHALKATRKGHKEIEEKVEVAAASFVSVEFALEAIPMGRLVVRTSPASCRLTCEPLGLAGVEKSTEEWTSEDIPEGTYAFSVESGEKRIDREVAVKGGALTRLSIDFVANQTVESQESLPTTAPRSETPVEEPPAGKVPDSTAEPPAPTLPPATAGGAEPDRMAAREDRGMLEDVIVTPKQSAKDKVCLGSRLGAFKSDLGSDAKEMLQGLALSGTDVPFLLYERAKFAGRDARILYCPNVHDVDEAPDDAAVAAHNPDASDFEGPSGITLVGDALRAAVKDGPHFPLLWDKVDNHEGYRFVLFADGHVEEVQNRQFQDVVVDYLVKFAKR